MHKFHRRGVLSSLLIGGGVAAVPGSSSKAETSSGEEGFWTTYLRGRIGGGAQGWAAAFSSGGHVSFGVSGGWSDRAGRRPMAPDTRIHVASASKPITAVALLQALDRAELDEKVAIGPYLSGHFPDVHSDVAALTVEEVLTHNTGWPFAYANTPRLESLRQYIVQALPAPADRRRAYSNINYSVARTVLEALTGRTYEAYVREEVFGPAGIERARMSATEDQVSTSYLMGQNEGRKIAIDFTDEGGAYGWYMTAEELALFAGAVAEDRLLPPALKQRMLSRGMGWNASRIDAGRVLSHEGQWVIDGNIGIHTGLAIAPSGQGAALILNTTCGIHPPEILASGFDASMVGVSTQVARDNTSAFVRLGLPAAADAIRYTVDGSDPGESSALYEGPIRTGLPATVKAVAFRDGRPIGAVGQTSVEPRRQRSEVRE